MTKLTKIDRMTRKYRDWKRSFWFVNLDHILDHLNTLERHNRIKIRPEEYSGKTKLLCTSGSTDGAPKYIKIDKEQLEARWAAEWWTMTWTGWRLGDPWAHLWYPSVREHGDNLLRRHMQTTRRKLENCLFMSYFNLSPELMLSHFHELIEHKPKLLVGYSEALFTYAIWLNQQSFSIHIPYIISSGGHLSQDWKDEIERAFGGTVLNRYGCSEVGLIAMEDPRHPRPGRLRIMRERGLTVDSKAKKLLISDALNKSTRIHRLDLGDTGYVRGDYIENLVGKLKSERSYLRMRR